MYYCILIKDSCIYCERQIHGWSSCNKKTFKNKSGKDIPILCSFLDQCPIDKKDYKNRIKV